MFLDQLLKNIEKISRDIEDLARDIEVISAEIKPIQNRISELMVKIDMKEKDGKDIELEKRYLSSLVSDKEFPTNLLNKKMNELSNLRNLRDLQNQELAKGK